MIERAGNVASRLPTAYQSGVEDTGNAPGDRSADPGRDYWGNRLEADPLEDREDLVQELCDAAQRPGAVKKSGNRAQEVPQEVPRGLNCRDVEDHAIEVHHKTQDVKV
jgi:hypothetical protein